MDNKRRIRKSVWLPIVLSLYFIFMATYFGKEMIAGGRVWQFAGICVGEIAVLILLVVFLRKRENLKK